MSELCQVTGSQANQKQIFFGVDLINCKGKVLKITKWSQIIILL